MRVAYCEESDKISGGGRVTEMFLRNQADPQLQPIFVSPGPGPMAACISALGVPVTVLADRQPALNAPLQTLRSWWRWNRLAGAQRLNLIHANGFMSARAATLAARWRRIPLLCHLHFVHGPETCRWVFHRLPKPVGFIFCSPVLKERMGAMLSRNYPAVRQWIVTNGVDTSLFRPGTCHNEIPRVGIVGNLQRIKGHELFLETARILVRSGRRIQFDIVGGETIETGRLQTLKTLADEMGLGESVHFHGHVDRVEDVIRSLDIVVCTSEFESFGLSIIEAMASAKPVVAARVGGIPFQIEDQRTGIIVPAREAGHFANAIERLITDAPLRQVMGQRARDRAERDFSLQAFCDKILMIYRQILKETNSLENHPLRGRHST